MLFFLYKKKSYKMYATLHTTILRILGIADERSWVRFRLKSILFIQLSGVLVD